MWAARRCQAVALALLLGLATSLVQAQAQRNVEDLNNCQNPSQPCTGSVAEGGSYLFHNITGPAGSNPTFALTVAPTSGSQATLDLYCDLYNSTRNRVPGPESDPPSAQFGSDFKKMGFSSTSSDPLVIAPANYTGTAWEGGVPRLVCTVHNPAPSPADGEPSVATTFTLTVTLSYDFQAAAQELYSQCCQGGCSEQLQGLAADPSTPFCEVPGFSCSNGVLVSLNLTGSGLSCAFPTDALAQFYTLQGLYAANNKFEGPFPSGLVQFFPNLVALDLSSAGLQGPLPDLAGGFTKLRRLSLSGNALDGPIPQSWGGIGMFVQGPASLATEEQATALFELSSNKLSGDLPAWLNNSHWLDGMYKAEGSGDVWPLEARLQANSFSNACAPEFSNAGACTQPGESPPAPSPGGESPPAVSPSPAPSPPPAVSSGGSSGLSGGAIAGIVIAVIVALVAGLALVLYVRKRQHVGAQASIFGGNTRFERFEEDGLARPSGPRDPRDVEMV